MGTMMMYKCNDCGFSKELHLGSGMMLPNASEKLKAAIASGEYGPELKGAYEECELPVVCPESKVYECPRCGYWDVYQNASVYEPTDVAAARKKRFGAKTVAEWGEIPYVFERELESDEYRLAREFTPSCPKCGEGMHTHQSHAVKNGGAAKLKCPHCGASNGSLEFFGCWD